MSVGSRTHDNPRQTHDGPGLVTAAGIGDRSEKMLSVPRPPTGMPDGIPAPATGA
jgi:hypothetical protein